MAKIFAVIGKILKPVPFRLKDKTGHIYDVPERFVMREGTEVILEFTDTTDFVLEPYTCHTFFKRGELGNFRVIEHEVSIYEFEDYKDNTQHRYTLVKKDADNRVLYMENQYRA